MIIDKLIAEIQFRLSLAVPLLKKIMGIPSPSTARLGYRYEYDYILDKKNYLAYLNDLFNESLIEKEQEII